MTMAPGSPGKLSQSAHPSNTLEALRDVGCQSFSDIALHRDTLKAAHGLDDAALDELVRLSPWLDIPWVDYDVARLVVGSGIATPADYYRLSDQAKRALEPQIPFGSVPLKNSSPCFYLEPIYDWRREDPSGEFISFLRGPAVDWRWVENTYAIGHVITSRPWWGVPDRDIRDPSDPQYVIQKSWYPDPALGWDVLGYQFGGATGGSLGYLLVYQRTTGRLRLFVYIPATNQGSYSQLLAHLFLTDRLNLPIEEWNLCLDDVPPQGRDIPFPNSEGAPRIGGGLEQSPPAQPVIGSPTAASFVWKNTGEPFDDLDPGSSTGAGRWVRTEAILALYDPLLYPAGPAPSDEDRRILHVGFSGLSVGDVDLATDLGITASGTAVPSVSSVSDDGRVRGSGRSTFGAVKDVFVSGLSAGGGAASIAGWAGLSLASGWGAVLVGGGAIVGLVGGLLGGADPLIPPEYDLSISGRATGEARGKSYVIKYLPSLQINLAGTFSCFDGSCPIGYPQAYQRCADARLGVIGFQGPDSWRDSDPRPRNQQFFIVPTLLGDGPDFYIAPQFLASLRVAPWATDEVEIVDQKVRIEVIAFNGSPPYRAAVTNFVHPGTPAASQLYEFNFDPRPRSSVLGDMIDAVRASRGKFYLRWIARLNEKRGNTSPAYFHYAVDVADRVFGLLRPEGVSSVT